MLNRHVRRIESIHVYLVMRFCNQFTKFSRCRDNPGSRPASPNGFELFGGNDPGTNAVDPG